MASRRVDSLTYRLETDDTVSFDAAPVSHETDTFSLRLEDDKLIIDLYKHFSSVEEARARLEPFLEAWEVKYAIQHCERQISFSYEDAEVVSEESEDDVIIVEGLKHQVELSGRVSFHVEREKYPDPPKKFRLSPNARTLWNRYEGYEEGQEPLFSMGYACLDFLRWRAGGQKKAAKKYNISRGLLQKLGTLTAKRGHHEVARKPSKTKGEATPEEKKWIEEAVQKIVLQVGISDAGHDPETLTKGDLPPLP